MRHGLLHRRIILSLKPPTDLTPAYRKPVTNRRAFILPTSTPQHVQAQRILPYNYLLLYNLIADIESYPQFIPHCTDARILRRTSSNLPATATLTVGWGPIAETFTSRVYCVPGKSVEALSGNGVSSIPVKDLEVYKEIRRETEGVGREEGVFEMLRTRWDVRSLDGKNEGEKTEVKLDVEWGFKNPVYAAMGSAVVDKVAGVMVGAFERRVKDVLGDRKSH